MRPTRNPLWRSRPLALLAFILSLLMLSHIWNPRLLLWAHQYRVALGLSPSAVQVACFQDQGSIDVRPQFTTWAISPHASPAFKSLSTTTLAEQNCSRLDVWFRANDFIRPWPGFVLYHGELPGPPMLFSDRPYVGDVVQVSLWPVAFLATGFFLVNVWRRARTNPRRGCCSVCGYDLRASPRRCPECGTSILAAVQRPNEEPPPRAAIWPWTVGATVACIGFVLITLMQLRVPHLYRLDPARTFLLETPLAAKPVQVRLHHVPLHTILEELSRQAGVAFTVNWADMTSYSLVTADLDASLEMPTPLSLANAFAALREQNESLNVDRMDEEIGLDYVYVSENRDVHSGDRNVTVVYPVKKVLMVDDPKQVSAIVLPRDDLQKLVCGVLGPCLSYLRDEYTVDVDKRHMTVTASPAGQYKVRLLLSELQ